MVFLLVNVPPWFGFSYLLVVFRWATFQESIAQGGNLEFPVTYATALLTFASSTFLFRMRVGVSLSRATFLSACLVLTATAVFEVTYQVVGHFFYPSEITGAIWLPNYILNASWILLGLTSLEYWHASARFGTVAFALFLSWSVWIVVGFPQLFQPDRIAVALAANSVAKVLSFALVLSAIDFSDSKARTRSSTCS